MAKVPATIQDENIGLEDFDTTDMVMPTLRLDHQEGVMVDTLSGEQFPSLTVVLLGLVKQRILWPAEMSETKENPMCRSLNFSVGTPDPDKPERFPYAAAKLDPDQYPDLHLPCEACALKEWGSNPKNQTPWCSEQWTFPLMMPAGEGWAPAVFTLQRSNLKAARAYMTSFARSKKPLFTTETKITLQSNKRGTVKYVNTMFAKGDDTPSDFHPELAENYRRIREWLQTPRDEAPSDDEGTSVSNPSSAAVADEDLDF